MRAIVRSMLFAVLGVSMIAFGAEAMIRPDVVVIKLKPQAAKTVRDTRAPRATGLSSLDQLNIKHDSRDFRPVVSELAKGNSARDQHGLGRYYIVGLAPGTDVLKAVAAYAADPNVELAEPDYLVPLDMIPNDPDYGMQWTHFSALGKDIDTQQGWDLEVGDSTVLIGVIDSGIKYVHADLNAAVWVNPGEDLDGDGVVMDPDDLDGLDSDGNGYFDDLIGWDFLSGAGGCWAGEDCSGQDNDPDDFAGHGTHVNGIIGAITDNATGVAGIAGGQRSARRPGVKLLGLRAGYLADESGTPRGYVIMSACAEAVAYARDKGVSVINCSWGSSGSLIRDAILLAVADGVVVCKSAGNDMVDTPDIVDSTFGVLAVAALEVHGYKAGFSNYGTWVDISAPGNNIYNTYSNLGSATYASLSGTSMASPTVAGVAALLKSHHPWFTKTQIDTLLTNYAVDTDPDNPLYIGLLGSGNVNAYNSLSILTTADFDIDTGFGWVPWTVNFTNTSPNAPSGPYEYDFGDGNTGAGPDASHTYNDPGVFTVKFTGDGPSGPHTRIRPEMVVVVRDTIEYGDIAMMVGAKAPFPVRLRNTHPMNEIILPILLNGPSNVIIDSCVLTAPTANWTKERVFAGGGGATNAWRLRALSAGVPVPAGSDVIANLWVRVVSGSNGAIETIDSGTLGSSQYGLKLASSYVGFKPAFVSGQIAISTPCDCHCQGDPDCNGVIDVLDVVGVVNVAFRGQADTQDASCPSVGRSDVTCNGAVDVLDVVAVVGKAFRGDQTPQCDPCG